jgi:hypothetical protein
VPTKLLLIAVLAGPPAAAAVLSIRGEPAYRWLLRGPPLACAEGLAPGRHRRHRVQ